MKKYRDGLFRDYFSDKKRLLELCNGLLGENGKNPDEIIFNTLDGIFFEELKNDLSCIYRGKFLVIIEHQSTVNENMPLRIFLYAAEIFKRYTKIFKKKIYLKEKIKLPAPNFFVFYNGRETEIERREMKLSDAFEGENNFLEAVVKVFNINEGFNKNFVEKIQPLNEYCIFVNRVQKNLSCGMSLEEAIAEAFRYCIENGIMAEYLLSRQGELVSMLGLEYDAEEAKQAFIEYGEEKGRNEKSIEMIKKMFAMKMSLEDISKISEWSKEKILKVIN